MLSCITTILFTPILFTPILFTPIFTALSSALDTSSIQPPYHSPHAPVRLSRYLNYYNSAYNYVFFNHPDEPHFNLTIVTAYLQFYPPTLAAWLAEKGFTVFPTSSLTNADLCGWIYGSRVTVDGRRHGQIGWKRSADGNASAATTPSHVPHDSPLKPRSATFAVVEAVLRDNTPHADIYFLRTVLLDMACGILGAMLVYCVTISCVENRRKSKLLRGGKVPGDVELEPIKVQRSAVESGAGSVADPPPVYTLDGAGRSPVRGREVV